MLVLTKSKAWPRQPLATVVSSSDSPFVNASASIAELPQKPSTKGSVK